jgi:hypothetical protein
VPSERATPLLPGACVTLGVKRCVIRSNAINESPANMSLQRCSGHGERLMEHDTLFAPLWCVFAVELLDVIQSAYRRTTLQRRGRRAARRTQISDGSVRRAARVDEDAASAHPCRKVIICVPPLLRVHASGLPVVPFPTDIELFRSEKCLLRADARSPLQHAPFSRAGEGNWASRCPHTGSVRPRGPRKRSLSLPLLQQGKEGEEVQEYVRPQETAHLSQNALIERQT